MSKVSKLLAIYDTRCPGMDVHGELDDLLAFFVARSEEREKDKTGECFVNYQDTVTTLWSWLDVAIPLLRTTLTVYDKMVKWDKEDEAKAKKEVMS